MFGPDERRRLRALPIACGIVLAAAAAVRLAQAIPRVPNRHALVWDAARRAVLDLEAADALRRMDLAAFAWRVAGPETWPTLRLVLAAPLHALAGPEHAWAVEHGVSIAAYAGLAIALALFARAITTCAADALLVLLASASLLAGNRALLTHAANGMLEPASALLTLGAVTAWIASREARTDRPWTVALLGNLLFHVKWQHGIFFCAALLCVETGGDGLERAAATMRSFGNTLATGLRSRSGRWLAAAAAMFGIGAAAVALTGGFERNLAGARLAVRDPHGPIAFAALAAFAFVQLAVWLGRKDLSSVPPRLRFLWTWLLTPMAAWLVVPFTWRIRILTVTAARYDSGQVPHGLPARLLFYPRAIWETWFPPGAHLLVALLLAATVLAVWLSRPIRRRLTPIVALALVEWLALSLASRHNYQPRFVDNLAPLLAGAAFAWIPAVPRAAWRALPALVTGAAVLALAAPVWRAEALPDQLASGFDPVERAEACRRVAEAAPRHAVFVNEAPASHRQGCALWATIVARQRGTALTFEQHPRSGWDDALVVSECTRIAAPPPGWAPAGDVVRAEPLCAMRYQRLRAASAR